MYQNIPEIQIHWCCFALPRDPVLSRLSPGTIFVDTRGLPQSFPTNDPGSPSVTRCMKPEIHRIGSEKMKAMVTVKILENP